MDTAPAAKTTPTMRVVFIWVWYIIATGLVSLLSTLAIRIPAEWTSRHVENAHAA